MSYNLSDDGMLRIAGLNDDLAAFLLPACSAPYLHHDLKGALI